MTNIVKAVLSLTVLLPEDQVADFKGATLEAILEETDTGAWIAGTVQKSEPVVVPADKLEAELQAIGNDGSFFDDETAEDESPAP